MTAYEARQRDLQVFARWSRLYVLAANQNNAKWTAFCKARMAYLQHKI